MGKYPSILSEVFDELVDWGKQIDEAELDQMADAIAAANQIFVAGAGRSGFAARAFANRLTHTVGHKVHFVGEVTQPPIGAGDLLIINSGSGTTKGLVAMAETAVKNGASIATVTIFPARTIGSMSKAIIRLPVTTNMYLEPDKRIETIQPMGNTYEQLSLIVLD
ncbi:MAG: SIS domain-containing protein, partial [Oscillospiraceae bacterium]|nr:SIS domain-containing protein [Oscillospiraceae bacterium]